MTTTCTSSLIHFHDAIAWLMQISIFVLSGLLVHPSRIPSVALPALAIAVVLDDTVPPCDAHHAQHVPHWDLCAGSRRGGNSQAVRRWFFMAIIVTMSETLPLANVKSRFSEMVDRVDRTHDRIIVARNGRATAVLVSQGELDALEDTLDLLSDPEATAQLEQSRREVESGDVVTGEELRAQYPLK